MLQTWHGRPCSNYWITHDYDFVLVHPTGGKYYGRIVATILVGKDRINLSEYLIEKGLGYPYTGGKKPKFDEWYPYRKLGK